MQQGQGCGLEEDVASEGSVTVLIPFDDVPVAAWGAELRCCAAIANAVVQCGVRAILMEIKTETFRKLRKRIYTWKAAIYRCLAASRECRVTKLDAESCLWGERE